MCVWVVGRSGLEGEGVGVWMASGMREHSVGGISEGLSFSLSSMSIGMEASSVPYTELSIACQGLKDRDWTSVSDPFAILSEMRSNGIFVERDRTEVIWNDLNPKFCKKFQFEDDDVDKRFQLTFMDFDHLKGDDFLGSLQFTLREVRVFSRHPLHATPSPITFSVSLFAPLALTHPLPHPFCRLSGGFSGRAQINFWTEEQERQGWKAKRSATHVSRETNSNRTTVHSRS